jgi:hypothetical protein
LERANQVIQKHYDSAGLTFLLLGNAAKFGDDLKKFGTEIVTVPISRPGLRVEP